MVAACGALSAGYPVIPTCPDCPLSLPFTRVRPTGMAASGTTASTWPPPPGGHPGRLRLRAGERARLRRAAPRCDVPDRRPPEGQKGGEPQSGQALPPPVAGCSAQHSLRGPSTIVAWLSASSFSAPWSRRLCTDGADGGGQGRQCGQVRAVRRYLQQAQVSGTLRIVILKRVSTKLLAKQRPSQPTCQRWKICRAHCGGICSLSRPAPRPAMQKVAALALHRS